MAAVRATAMAVVGLLTLGACAGQVPGGHQGRGTATDRGWVEQVWEPQRDELNRRMVDITGNGFDGWVQPTARQCSALLDWSEAARAADAPASERLARAWRSVHTEVEEFAEGACRGEQGDATAGAREVARSLRDLDVVLQGS